MRIQKININTPENKNFSKHNTNLANTISKKSTPPLNLNLTNQNNVAFTGFFTKKRTEIEDTSEDLYKDVKVFPPKIEDKKTDDITLDTSSEILSLKIADTMHRLDKNSLIVVGGEPAFSASSTLQVALDKGNERIPNPKDINKIYHIQNKAINDPFIIGLDSNNSKNDFYIIASGKMLKGEQKRENGEIYKFERTDAKYNDIFEDESGIKIKFSNTPKESGEKFYTEYTLEKFLNAEIKLNLPKFDDLPCSHQKDNEFKITKSNKTFGDVGGMDKVISQVKQEILFPMIYPEAFEGKINKGAILYGPPGTGKTLLALAIAGEAEKRTDNKMNFLKIDGSEQVTSNFGETEAKWRKIFNEAKKHEPCILFIDEIDQVTPKRKEGSNNVPGNAVTTQFLTLLSDLEKDNSKVYIIGATNRLDMIDSAIKRNGRFGTQIEIPKPDKNGCKNILNIHLKNLNVDKNFDKDKFSQKLYSQGATGSDIASIAERLRGANYARTGIFEKMDNGTFKNDDLDKIVYNEDDFNEALNLTLPQKN